MAPFQYEAGQGEGIAPGARTDTGTLTVAIGEKIQISLGASAYVNVCAPSYPCNQPYEAELAGSVKYEITSVPSGVTYTTASGNMYTP